MISGEWVMVKRKRNRWTIGKFSGRWLRAIANHPLWAGLIGLSLVLLTWLLINFITLRSNAMHSVDAYLVLGGSIKREIYTAELAKRHPEIPILISQGSEDPCIWLIFQRVNAPIEQVWLEHCANSTFGNFYFSTPTLVEWDVHRMKLITSATHLPRAMWMAQILLGAHGIWVESEIAPEQGVPGNQESSIKTALDVGRSLIWALVGQIHWPQCPELSQLSTVNMEQWRQQGFKCEHQGNL
jgi:uncharacterized SAM-binding protein YcdF (DUF218 family)